MEEGGETNRQYGKTTVFTSLPYKRELIALVNPGTSKRRLLPIWMWRFRQKESWNENKFG
jgi:hypothetical protein